jgi:hypothetical protein
MVYQVLGCLFGLFMAVHYYLLLVLLPAMVDAFLEE